MTHLFAPSIPAYKTPSSRRSFIVRVAGRGFGYGFDAQSSRLFPTGARRGSRYQKLGRVHVNEVAKSKLEAAFDYVGRVIARRRYGHASEWRRLASWTEKDWDRWLSATGHVSN